MTKLTVPVETLRSIDGKPEKGYCFVWILVKDLRRVCRVYVRDGVARIRSKGR